MARLIGLTGGIASGKSTVSRLLASRGAAIIDSDVLAREVVEPGTPGLDAVVAAFGDGVLTPEGRLDRAALGRIVFADAQSRARLEDITHPRIAELTMERIDRARSSGAPLVVLDIPLLYERDRQGIVDGVMVVWCDRATQLRRLVERDGLALEEAEQRLAAQMDLEEKRRRADWVVDNSGDRASTEAQVAAWWETAVGSAPDGVG